MTGHYIVCGMGHLGYRIADLLLRLGEGAAVITEGSREDWVGDVEARGARIVRGDARSAARLRDAGIDGARALIAAIKLDMTNVEIAVEARQLRPELLRREVGAERLVAEARSQVFVQLAGLEHEPGAEPPHIPIGDVRTVV